MYEIQASMPARQAEHVTTHQNSHSLVFSASWKGEVLDHSMHSKPLQQKTLLPFDLMGRQQQQLLLLWLGLPACADICRPPWSLRAELVHPPLPHLYVDAQPQLKLLQDYCTSFPLGHLRPEVLLLCPSLFAPGRHNSTSVASHIGNLMSVCLSRRIFKS